MIVEPADCLPVQMMYIYMHIHIAGIHTFTVYNDKVLYSYLHCE